MSHIFISYSKQNIDFARHLRGLLQDEGFAVWMDETRLEPSNKWWPAIEENIKSCNAFIVIMSPQSQQSTWVEREILVAEKAKKRIFPVLFSGEPWSRLAELQYEDMQQGIESQLSIRLVRGLEAVVSRSAADTLPPQLPGESMLRDTDTSSLGDVNRASTSSNRVAQFLGRPWWQGVGVIVALILGIVGLFAASQSPPSAPTPDLTATYGMTQTALAVALAPTDTPGVPMASFTTGVNLRSGPDTIFAPVGALGVSDSVEVLAVNPDGTWYKVLYEGGEGWMFGDLAVISGDISNLPVDSGPSLPTLRPTDTLTATDSPTLTDTPLPPTATFTPAPPTATVTPEAPSNTPIPSSANTVTLTLFRDGHSLTLYMPESAVPVSLAGLEFRVNVSADEQLVRRLDTDYAAFLGLPFSNISSLGAVCLRLVQTSSNEPVPQACQSGTLLIPQQLATVDLFWLDMTARLERTVFVYRGDDLLGVCGPGDSCTVALPVDGGEPTSTPVPTQPPTLVPSPTEVVRGYPCAGTIIFRSGGIIQAKISPLRNSPSRLNIQQGETVQVLERRNNDGENWYQISYDDKTAWITTDLVELSVMCQE